MNSKVYSEKMLEEFRTSLNDGIKHIVSYPKFIFVCGKGFNNLKEKTESNRYIIQQYMKSINKNLYFVWSENIWDDAFKPNIDLLTFEEFLAELSDCIILIAESTGAFCELGAFSYSDKLFKDKLVVVIDNKYRNSKSFLMTGPVEKIKRDGSDVVYADLFNGSILSSKELREKLDDKIQKLTSKGDINKKSVNSKENKVELSSFVVELLELIKITQPVNKHELMDIYKGIKKFDSVTFVKKDGEEFHNEIKFRYILTLLKVTKLISIDNEYVTLNNYSSVQQLMFNHKGNQANVQRNRLLCRKYKFGDKV